MFKISTLLLLCAAAFALADDENGFFDQETDAIVIEATPENARDGRQYAWAWPQWQFGTQMQQAPAHSCYTSEGKAGNCATLKSCYPFYRLKYNLPNWALGTKDTCQTSDATGRHSVYGVCCSTRQFGGQQFGGQQFGGQQFGGQFGNVPYPIIPGVSNPFVPQHPGVQQGGQGIQFTPGVFQPFGSGQPVHAPAPAPPVTQATTTQATIPVTTPTTPAPAPAPVTTTTTTSAPAPASDESDDDNTVNYDRCGVGRNFPIQYTEEGIEMEAYQRIHGEHPLRVVNGWPADQNEWPWIAALLNNGRQFCGGSLIDNQHILTAAHCVAHMTRNDVARLTVRLGDHDIKTAGETQTFETKVSRVVRHKGFSSETLHNDVALITLDKPVPAKYKSTIRPVCMPHGSERYDGKYGTVVGWGSLHEKGPQPAILQELTMKIWSNDECAKTYGSYAPGGITEHMLCAGQKGKDSCSGDSGGPFVVADGDHWTQVGIVSWGIGCGKAHYPGVYTRTTDMKPWIQKVQRKF